MKSLNILNRLKIRTKLILFMVIPVLTILVFSISGIYTKVQELEAIKSSSNFTTVSLLLADLVHELQKERGLSAGFVGSGGQNFKEEVPKQRKQTDEKLRLFNEILDNNTSGGNNWGLSDKFTILQQELYVLPATRTAINTLKQGNFFDYYSNINALAINIIHYLQVLTKDATLARQGDAYSSLIHLQERAGQERGALNGIFASGKLDSKLFQEISAYIADQKGMINNYYTVVSSKYQDILREKMKHPVVIEVEALRAAAINKARRNELLNDLQMMIGYGGLIHDFKDYVIRGRDWYIEHFSELSIEAKNIIEQYQDLPGMSSQGIAYLNSIETTFKQYQGLLKDVAKMKKLGHSIIEIDALTNIDDKSAIEAIKQLRKDVTSLDTSKWWEKATFRIELIKEVSDAIRSDIVFRNQQIIETTKQSASLYILLSITSLSISFILGYFLMRRLVEELVNISNNMHNMQEHRNIDQRLVVSGHDEIADMANAFNDLINEREKSEADLKQTEEALRKNQILLNSILNNSTAVIYVKNIEGKYILINRQYEKLFHVTQEEIIGKRDYDYFPKEVADELYEHDKEVMENCEVMEYEELIPHSDGTHIYISTKFPILNGGNEIYAVCGISVDITERIRQEEQLRRSQKMDALGNLTGGIAHDYNNMLGVILGYAELLESSLSAQPNLAKYANEISHAGKRGAKLTKKLLDFSRKKASEEDILNLNTLLLNQRHMLEKTLTVRIELVLNLAEDLWSIWINDSEMEDIILNMSINAMHAIEGNGQLTIQTNNQTLNQMDAQALGLTSGDYVLLSFSDTGCGMNEATKEKIFEPFFSTKGEKGTGLGLSQVYGFVRRSCGAIKVYSELGHGTRFVLYFPHYHESDSNEESAKDHSVMTVAGNESILVVDDEPALLNLTCEILDQHGFNVISAENAKQALDKLEHETVDLLISDIIMPEMDGYQLAAIVKEKYPAMKIQLASGYSDDRNMGIVSESLKKNLLFKPFNSQVLLQRIRELFNEK